MPCREGTFGLSEDVARRQPGTTGWTALACPRAIGRGARVGPVVTVLGGFQLGG